MASTVYKNQNQSKESINHFNLKSVKPSRLVPDSHKETFPNQSFYNKMEKNRTKCSTICFSSLLEKPGRLLPDCKKTYDAVSQEKHTPVIETVLDSPTLSRDGSMKGENSTINLSVSTLCSTCTKHNCTNLSKKSKKDKTTKSLKKLQKNSKKIMDKLEQEVQDEKEKCLPEIPKFRSKGKRNKKNMKKTTLNKQRNIISTDKTPEARTYLNIQRDSFNYEKKIQDDTSEVNTSLNIQRNPLNDLENSTENSEAEASLNIQRNLLNDLENSTDNSEAEASLNILRNSLNSKTNEKTSDSELEMKIQRSSINQVEISSEVDDIKKYNIPAYNIDVSNETHLLNTQRNTSLNDIKTENSTNKEGKKYITKMKLQEMKICAR